MSSDPLSDLTEGSDATFTFLLLIFATASDRTLDTYLEVDFRYIAKRRGT